ncbi:Flavodoxin reductases (ferredoxin-NADPH reductases) family 1 [Bacillus sp. ZZV12-4809]|nr:Flavodoxin reductases (ferredoxin-NADPH reductases) family 1 [Bacillus sp. ZZV12-4809]
MNDKAGSLKEIYRFPVKSILGEPLSKASVDERGLIGDRLWAIKNTNGKFGSGKTTRRFQRMDGLFQFKFRYEGTVPIIKMPDGTEYRADNHVINEKLTECLGVQVSLSREESISHFDEGPISIITTSALRQLRKELGEPADIRRFRANFLIDTEAPGYLEDDWIDRLIKVGPNVILRVAALLPRCVMVNNQQEDLKEDDRILRHLVNNHNGTFGVWAKVVRFGEVKVGDEVILQ